MEPILDWKVICIDGTDIAVEWIAQTGGYDISICRHIPSGEFLLYLDNERLFGNDQRPHTYQFLQEAQLSAETYVKDLIVSAYRQFFPESKILTAAKDAWRWLTVGRTCPPNAREARTILEDAITTAEGSSDWQHQTLSEFCLANPPGFSHG